jgi:hypothetical protein
MLTDLLGVFWEMRQAYQMATATAALAITRSEILLMRKEG